MSYFSKVTLTILGEESDASEPNNYMSAMLQAGEITCPVCIDPIKHADPVCIICKIFFFYF